MTYTFSSPLTLEAVVERVASGFSSQHFLRKFLFRWGRGKPHIEVEDDKLVAKLQIGKRLSHFEGEFLYNSQSKQLLLTGSFIESSSRALGMVAFTGFVLAVSSIGALDHKPVIASLFIVLGIGMMVVFSSSIRDLNGELLGSIAELLKTNKISKRAGVIS